MPSYTQNDLEKAVSAIQEENITLSAASSTYNVPRTTLSKHISELRRKSQAAGGWFKNFSKHGFGKKRIMTADNTEDWDNDFEVDDEQFTPESTNAVVSPHVVLDCETSDVILTDGTPAEDGEAARKAKHNLSSDVFNVITLNEASGQFVYDNITNNVSKTLHWCFQFGLMTDKECSVCCQQTGQVVEWEASIDKCELKCSNCRSMLSVRTNSLFDGYDIHLNTLVSSIYLWTKKANSCAPLTTALIPKDTLLKWHDHLRHVCYMSLLESSQVLGADNSVVQLGIFTFSTVMIIGGVDGATRQHFLVELESLSFSNSAVATVVETFVKRGSRIRTDEQIILSAMKGRDHNYTFEDFKNYRNLNIWKTIVWEAEHFKKNVDPLVLSEAIYRFKNGRKFFGTFLRDCKEIFPPISRKESEEDNGVSDEDEVVITEKNTEDGKKRTDNSDSNRKGPDKTNKSNTEEETKGQTEPSAVSHISCFTIGDTQEEEVQGDNRDDYGNDPNSDSDESLIKENTLSIPAKRHVTRTATKTKPSIKGMYTELLDIELSESSGDEEEGGKSGSKPDPFESVKAAVARTGFITDDISNDDEPRDFDGFLDLQEDRTKLLRKLGALKEVEHSNWEPRTPPSINKRKLYNKEETVSKRTRVEKEQEEAPQQYRDLKNPVLKLTRIDEFIEIEDAHAVQESSKPEQAAKINADGSLETNSIVKAIASTATKLLSRKTPRITISKKTNKKSVASGELQIGCLPPGFDTSTLRMYSSKEVSGNKESSKVNVVSLNAPVSNKNVSLRGFQTPTGEWMVAVALAPDDTLRIPLVEGTMPSNSRRVFLPLTDLQRSGIISNARPPPSSFPAPPRPSPLLLPNQSPTLASLLATTAASSYRLPGNMLVNSSHPVVTLTEPMDEEVVSGNSEDHGDVNFPQMNEEPQSILSTENYQPEEADEESVNSCDTPCSIHCPEARGLLPDTQCCVCLCMCHAQCISNLDGDVVCKICFRLSEGVSELKSKKNVEEEITLISSDSDDELGVENKRISPQRPRISIKTPEQLNQLSTESSRENIPLKKGEKPVKSTDSATSMAIHVPKPIEVSLKRPTEQKKVGNIVTVAAKFTSPTPLSSLSYNTVTSSAVPSDVTANQVVRVPCDNATATKANKSKMSFVVDTKGGVVNLVKGTAPGRFFSTDADKCMPGTILSLPNDPSRKYIVKGMRSLPKSLPPTDTLKQNSSKESGEETADASGVHLVKIVSRMPVDTPSIPKKVLEDKGTATEVVPVHHAATDTTQDEEIYVWDDDLLSRYRHASKELCDGDVTVNQAVSKYNLSKTCLINFLQGNFPVQKGKTGVLTAKEEVALVDWLTKLSERGFTSYSDLLHDYFNGIMNNQLSKTVINKLFKGYPSLETLITKKSRTLMAVDQWITRLKNLQLSLSSITTMYLYIEVCFPIVKREDQLVLEAPYVRDPEVEDEEGVDVVTICMCCNNKGELLSPLIVLPKDTDAIDSDLDILEMLKKMAAEDALQLEELEKKEEEKRLVDEAAAMEEINPRSSPQAERPEFDSLICHEDMEVNSGLEDLRSSEEVQRNDIEISDSQTVDDMDPRSLPQAERPEFDSLTCHKEMEVNSGLEDLRSSEEVQRIDTEISDSQTVDDNSEEMEVETDPDVLVKANEQVKQSKTNCSVEKPITEVDQLSREEGKTSVSERVHEEPSGFNLDATQEASQGKETKQIPVEEETEVFKRVRAKNISEEQIPAVEATNDSSIECVEDLSGALIPSASSNDVIEKVREDEFGSQIFPEESIDDSGKHVSKELSGESVTDALEKDNSDDVSSEQISEKDSVAALSGKEVPTQKESDVNEEDTKTSVDAAGTQEKYGIEVLSSDSVIAEEFDDNRKETGIENVPVERISSEKATEGSRKNVGKDISDDTTEVSKKHDVEFVIGGHISSEEVSNKGDNEDTPVGHVFGAEIPEKGVTEDTSADEISEKDDTEDRSDGQIPGKHNIEHASGGQTSDKEVSQKGDIEDTSDEQISTKEISKIDDIEDTSDGQTNVQEVSRKDFIDYSDEQMPANKDDSEDSSNGIETTASSSNKSLKDNFSASRNEKQVSTSKPDNGDTVILNLNTRILSEEMDKNSQSDSVPGTASMSVRSKEHEVLVLNLSSDSEVEEASPTKETSQLDLSSESDDSEKENTKSTNKSNDFQKEKTIQEPKHIICDLSSESSDSEKESKKVSNKSKSIVFDLSSDDDDEQEKAEVTAALDSLERAVEKEEVLIISSEKECAQSEPLQRQNDEQGLIATKNNQKIIKSCEAEKDCADSEDEMLEKTQSEQPMEVEDKVECLEEDMEIDDKEASKDSQQVDQVTNTEQKTSADANMPLSEELHSSETCGSLMESEDTLISPSDVEESVEAENRTSELTEFDSVEVNVEAGKCKGHSSLNSENSTSEEALEKNTKNNESKKQSTLREGINSDDITVQDSNKEERPPTEAETIPIQEDEADLKKTEKENTKDALVTDCNLNTVEMNNKDLAEEGLIGLKPLDADQEAIFYGFDSDDELGDNLMGHQTVKSGIIPVSTTDGENVSRSKELNEEKDPSTAGAIDKTKGTQSDVAISNQSSEEKKTTSLTQSCTNNSASEEVDTFISRTEAIITNEDQEGIICKGKATRKDTEDCSVDKSEKEMVTSQEETRTQASEIALGRTRSSLEITPQHVSESGTDSEETKVHGTRSKKRRNSRLTSDDQTPERPVKRQKIAQPKSPSKPKRASPPPREVPQCPKLHQGLSDMIVTTSENGHCDTSIFKLWVQTVFLKYRQSGGPKILFIPTESYLNMDLSTACENEEVILFRIHPYFYRANHPMLTGIMSYLSLSWFLNVSEINPLSRDGSCPFNQFPKVFRNLWKNVGVHKKELVEKFEDTGLYPHHRKSLMAALKAQKSDRYHRKKREEVATEGVPFDLDLEDSEAEEQDRVPEQPRSKNTTEERSDPAPHPLLDHCYSVNSPLSQRLSVVQRMGLDSSRTHGPHLSFISQLHSGYVSLFQVFRYLSLKDLLVTAQVSKLWKELSGNQKLWEVVELCESVKDWSKCLSHLKHCGCRSLDLTGARGISKNSGKDFIKAAVHLSSVNHLRIKALPHILQDSLKHAVSVNSLTVMIEPETAPREKNNCMDVSTWSELTDLEALHMTCESSAIKVDGLNYWALLSKLRLLELHNIQGNDLSCLSEMNQLEKLDLSPWTWMGEEGCESLKQCVNLRILCLTQEESTDELTDELGDALTYLKSLEQLILVKFSMTKSLGRSLVSVSSLVSLMLWPDYTTMGGETNTMILNCVKDLPGLKTFVWGIVSDDKCTVVLDSKDFGHTEDEPEMSGDQSKRGKLKKDRHLKCIPILLLEGEAGDKDKSDEENVQTISVQQLVNVLCNILPATTHVQVMKMKSYSYARKAKG